MVMFLVFLGVVAAMIVATYFAYGSPLIDGPKRIPSLDPKIWRRFRLVERHELTHNTRRLRFALPAPSLVLGLGVGQHLSIRVPDKDGKEIMRSYTPTTPTQTLGHFDLVIKVYPTGKVTPYLEALRVGQYIQARGPRGRFTYKRNKYRHIGMVAGGTGITPMFQVAQEILADKRDRTRLSLIFANLTEADILIRDELEELAGRDENTGRFDIYYTLDTPPDGWTGGRGRVTKEMLAERMPPPGPGVIVLRCGPLPMVKAVEELCTELGYSEDMQFAF